MVTVIIVLQSVMVVLCVATIVANIVVIRRTRRFLADLKYRQEQMEKLYGLIGGQEPAELTV